MGRLTVRLPDTLHRQIEDRARHEGVSLNQYIVFALTRQATLAYAIEPVPQEAIMEQRAQYLALLEQLGPTTHAEVERALDARQPADDAAELDTADLDDDTMERLRRSALQRLRSGGNAKTGGDG